MPAASDRTNEAPSTSKEGQPGTGEHVGPAGLYGKPGVGSRNYAEENARESKHAAAARTRRAAELFKPASAETAPSSCK